MQMTTILPMYVFTSQIPTLVFSQAGIDPLDVTVWAGRDKLLETTMYPVAGKIYLHDLGDLYEVATRNNSSSMKRRKRRADYRFRCSLLSARQVQDGFILIAATAVKHVRSAGDSTGNERIYRLYFI